MADSTLALDVRSADGSKAGSVELPAALFDVKTNIPLIHQVVVAQRAAARQGTHSTKRRGEVSGAGRKPFKQKGTGNARQGSLRAPQFSGGGIAHGPVPRDYTKKTPKKMKAAALRGALSDRAREGRVHVVSAFVAGDAPSTRSARVVLDSITTAKRVLVVLDRDDVLNWVSLRNLPRVHLIEAGQLNTYDVLVSDEVVFTESALAEYVAGPARGKHTGVTKPDLTTPDIPGAIPSIQPTTGTTDLDVAAAGIADSIAELVEIARPAGGRVAVAQNQEEPGYARRPLLRHDSRRSR